MVPSSRPSLALLLPLVAAVVAAAIVWGGVMLAKQERIERLPRSGASVERFASELQEKITALESQYERHLARICRTDLNHFFGVQDAIDGVVGVRQLSTLNPEGKIDLHLPASDLETIPALPIPVMDPRERPPGREVVAEVGGFDLFGGGEGESGWITTPQGRFYHQRVSIRRVILLLVDPAPVEASVVQTLAPWIEEQLAGSAKDGTVDRVRLHDQSVATTGEPDKTTPPDAVHTLATRFGGWQVQSWDGRRTLVTYRRDLLALAVALALLVLLAGVVAGFTVRRALRLAEQRVSFVNRVSHELKTPLTNILLNADLAADGADARGRQRLARVQEETRRLARLIDNVLAFSRRDSTPLTAPTALALRPLVDEVAETFTPSLKRRGVEIVVNGGEATHVLADPDSLRQILGNLLSNIEKYAAAGGLADITLAETCEDITMLVKDHGPGIPTREHERIFLPFHRLDDRPSEGVTGTGLGLAIARDLATAMGGSLRLVPQDGPGASFELRLPAAASANVITFPDSRAS
jgi:signal transduction histidine kinase